MALNCIKNKISYWDGCGEKPSVLLLNDLPGFTLNQVESLTTNERQTAADVMDAVIRMGAEKVEEDVTAYLWPSVTPVDSFQNITIGEIYGDLKTKTGIAGGKWGIRLRVDHAPFFSLYLNTVQYYPVANGSGTVNVYNVLTCNVILTQNITFTGGVLNSLELDTVIRFDGQPIDVIITIESDVNVYFVQAFNRGGCGSCSGRYVGNQYAWVDMGYIAAGNPVIDKNIKSINHTGGLIVNYSLRCDIADYICSLSVGLKRAIFYASGIALMDEIIFGKRLNSLTTVHKDDAIQMKAQFAAEYGNIMERVTATAKLPKSPCFYCNPSVIQVNRIP